MDAVERKGKSGDVASAEASCSMELASGESGS